jgi:hypothetical protein
MVSAPDDPLEATLRALKVAENEISALLDERDRIDVRILELQAAQFARAASVAEDLRKAQPQPPWRSRLAAQVELVYGAD